MISWSQVLFLALLWFLATFPVAVIVGKIIDSGSGTSDPRADQEASFWSWTEEDDDE